MEKERLEMLILLKERVRNRECITDQYYSGGQCCIIGHAFLINGRDKTFLQELDANVIADIGVLIHRGTVAPDALPLFAVELAKMQNLNDRGNWGYLEEYIDELIEKEREDA